MVISFFYWMIGHFANPVDKLYMTSQFSRLSLPFRGHGSKTYSRWVLVVVVLILCSQIYIELYNTISVLTIYPDP